MRPPWKRELINPATGKPFNYRGSGILFDHTGRPIIHLADAIDIELFGKPERQPHTPKTRRRLQEAEQAMAVLTRIQPFELAKARALFRLSPLAVDILTGPSKTKREKLLRRLAACELVNDVCLLYRELVKQYRETARV